MFGKPNRFTADHAIVTHNGVRIRPEGPLPHGCVVWASVPRVSWFRFLMWSRDRRMKLERYEENHALSFLEYVELECRRFFDRRSP